MNLLLDQSLPRSAATILRGEGIDAIHTSEIGLATAEDAIILEQGRLGKRIAVTFDADFHTLLALSNATEPSVIRIRIEGLRGEAVAEIIRHLLNQYNEDLAQGVAMTVQEERVRVRRLPILQ